MLGKLTELGVAVLLATSTAAAQAQGTTSSPGPTFRDYPVSEVFQGQPATPVFATAAQRLYRSRITNGVLHGAGVWSGSWRNPIKPSGPDFAGHYFVIRWGCGADCLMMAIVDAKTGNVYNPPLSAAGTTKFEVPMDILGDREIDFEPKTSLMVLRNACRVDRRECGIYYFNWKDQRFVFVKRKLVDLTSER